MLGVRGPPEGRSLGGGGPVPLAGGGTFGDAARMTTVYPVLVVAAGVLANLLIAAMFVARVVAPRHARKWGMAGTAMAVPLGAAAVVAIRSNGEAWDVALPLVFVAFAVVEVVVDVVLDVEVRTTRWLWPYLMLFYLAQWAVIGAAFRASEPGGAAVLAGYFVCLAATAYSYRRVGHGVEVHGTARRPSRGPTGVGPPR